jgi:hypothetical protein
MIPGRFVLKAFGLIVRPTTAWQSIAASSVEAELLPALRHAAMLSLLTSLSWSLGRLWLLVPASPAMSFLFALLSTFVLCMLAIALLAGALAVLLPAYGCPRNWYGAWVVAAYSATPVLLCGALLVLPVAVILMVVTLPYAFYLLSLGAHHVCGVRSKDTAEFTAATLVLTVAASMLTGGVLSAAAIL